MRQHFFAATVAAVRAGETSGAVLVLHDITELRKLERIRRVLWPMFRTNSVLR